MALDRNNRYTFTPSNATTFEELKLHTENQLREISNSMNLLQENTLVKRYYKKPDKYLENEIFINPSAVDGGTWNEEGVISTGQLYLYYEGDFLPLVNLPANNNFVLSTDTTTAQNVPFATPTLLEMEDARVDTQDGFDPLTGEYTVQDTGWYNLFYQLSYELISNGNQNYDFTMMIVKNGTDTLEATIKHEDSVGWHTQQVMTFVYLEEGDVIGTYVLHNSNKAFSIAAKIQEFFGFRVK